MRPGPTKLGEGVSAAEGGGLDLHAHEPAVALDTDVIAGRIALGLEHSQAHLAGARHEAQLGPFTLLFAGPEAGAVLLGGRLQLRAGLPGRFCISKLDHIPSHLFLPLNSFSPIPISYNKKRPVRADGSSGEVLPNEPAAASC